MNNCPLFICLIPRRRPDSVESIQTGMSCCFERHRMEHRMEHRIEHRIEARRVELEARQEGLA